MGIIDIKNLVFEYIRRDEEGNTEDKQFAKYQAERRDGISKS